MLSQSDRLITRAFFLTQLKGLLIIALLLALSDWGLNDRLDIWLADLFFDVNAQQFPLKDHWFTATVMHLWLKYLMLALALGLIVLLLHELISKKPKLDTVQLANLKIIVCAALIIPLLVGILKALSPIHCPWDLVRYGGSAVEFGFNNSMSGGKCFPAGHVTSTSWLMACTFIYLPMHGFKARWVWGLAFSLALMTGWAQQMRGAHFLCHTLWSLWLSWLVILALAYYFRGARGNRLAPSYQAL
ncbi:MAG: phosphatase PAP2 family protein [Thiofilum sp.]|uniref:phosphatase PAP2 family protein n=1 Tax=Thiofilum sp. TaxID=2212733 RepID=UPI0025E5D0E6|nr:phosphatase PAP2 family protein [Thiofilum sp.]MBK8451825.1 PAP2 family protein [Thiofilum sp.]